MSNKTLLLEVCAKKGWAAPQYCITKQGPDHFPQFSATVVVNDVRFVSQGFLGSKKEAEASAAGMALGKFLGYQSQQPISQNVKSLSSPVKVGCVNKVEGNPTWLSLSFLIIGVKGDTNITPKKKGADEVEQLLAQERKQWHKEKLQLELKNLELANAIDMKSNEIQQFEKKLQHMKEMATMEQKKTERMLSLVEEKKGENETLHMKVAELEKQLQAVSGDMEGGKKIIGLSNSFRKEQSYKDELEETRKALINVLRDGSKENIGVKILGDLEWEAFQVAAKREYFVEEEVNGRAKELCSIWENYIGDSNWKPFKVITDMRGRIKEIIDEEDEKLKKLKVELGNEAYDTVITALLEMKEYNPFGRYKVDAAQCYKKEAIACLEQAATSFCEMGLNELFTKPMSRDRSKRRAAACANRITE
ncbi:hypothetical protein ACLB2K_002599 [Fragaria x ananassa]